MKKNFLIKTLLIFFLVFVVLTWIIPASSYTGKYVEEGLNPIGIFDLFKYPLYSFATFIQYGMVILSIGIFYGILSKTGVYSILCDSIVKKIKKKKLFLGIITFILCLLSSVIGSPLILFIFVPFIYNLVILLGYDKKTGLAISVGSILVGNISSLFGNGVALTNIEIFNLSILNQFYIKLILFLMVSLLYVNYVLSRSYETKEKIELNFYSKNEKSNKSKLPLIILFIFTIIIVLLGIYHIDKLGFNLFKDIHNSLMNFDVNNFKLFENLFKGISGIGSWSNYDVMIFILIMSLVISWVYSIKLDEYIDGFKEGIKSTIKPALYAVLASLIFVVILNTKSNIMETINHFILNNNFSIIRTFLATISGGIFYNDYTWLTQSGFGNMLTLYDTNNYMMISVITSGVHGLLMFILPTSIILGAGSMYTGLDYKDWLKYIWKYVLLVFFVIIAISIVLIKIL